MNATAVDNINALLWEHIKLTFSLLVEELSRNWPSFLMLFGTYLVVTTIGSLLERRLSAEKLKRPEPTTFLERRADLHSLRHEHEKKGGFLKLDMCARDLYLKKEKELLQEIGKYKGFINKLHSLGKLSIHDRDLLFEIVDIDSVEKRPIFEALLIAVLDASKEMDKRTNECGAIFRK